ncbi:MAG: hypothetical protein COU69_04760 [Candidatus Pacebacteria bacterium CG10_big_fil_rev_8_21_14_0_10_56_10]|nr:MAG: hypothetical protein COU69_04760 [Candidatus Pacebacteria bacterium CG10_big_fil_rev_8_21_14_0_10_56_10]
MVYRFLPGQDNKLGEHLYQTPIEGLLYLEHKTSPDERGYYAELTRVPEIEQVLGASFDIKQINQSYSEQHVARGIHAENWNKLLTVVSGVCFCAWADLRSESSTFGDVVSMEVGEFNGSVHGSVFVAAGIGNSFCVTKGPVRYLYCVDQLYAERDTNDDLAISLFDPDLAISWPIKADEMVMSQRDRHCVTLRQAFTEKFAATSS